MNYENLDDPQISMQSAHEERISAYSMCIVCLTAKHLTSSVSDSSKNDKFFLVSIILVNITVRLGFTEICTQAFIYFAMQL